MTECYVGFLILHEVRVANDARGADAALSFAESPSWGQEIRYSSSIATPGHDLWRRPGMIPRKEFRTFVGDALKQKSVAALWLASSRENGPGYREVSFSRDALRGPFSITCGMRPVMGNGADAWVSDFVAFCDVVGAGTGVVAVMESAQHVSSECSEGGVLRDGVLQHPSPDQHARMRGANMRHIGTQYMRFPRWGTLVSHAHVAQLGGISAIEQAVQPAVVRALSGGVYFQLTESVANALGDEAMEKQRQFTELAAPLLPPPVVPR